MTIDQLPKRKDLLENKNGHPGQFKLPAQIQKTNAFINTLYKPDEVTSDWDSYKEFLQIENPEFRPRVMLVGHDMSEIENITLMALGGVVAHMNGIPKYVLNGPENISETMQLLESFTPHWIGFSLYTGLTKWVFDWIMDYKCKMAEKVSGKIMSFEDADKYLKNVVRENNGPLMSGNEVIYAPVIIGGHYNNYNYKKAFSNGGDYVVRGKGINLLRDILLNLFEPGIYHDPMPYANIPMMDRDGFYRDTIQAGLEKYSMGPVKSIITALGCSYSCTYCYVSSLIDNLNDAYNGTGILPPSIIQDRPLDTVVKEGKEILRLDDIYGARTRTVFDQADISLNNIEWWEQLRDRWMDNVKIPFYIQARPAMLAGKKGRKRIDVIAQKNLVTGISMAIESGDSKVRSLLLDRHENNDTIIDAIQNVKKYNVHLRTQCIVALPTMKPPAGKVHNLSLVDKNNVEHYYEDPVQEALQCLKQIICQSDFSKEDYYWNAMYSPFPGTPLGDYSIAMGFTDDNTDGRAYQFVYDSDLNCFNEITSRRLKAFSQTSNFFSHLENGFEAANLFLYKNEDLSLTGFSKFIQNNKEFFIIKKSIAVDRTLVGDVSDSCYDKFFIETITDKEFLKINKMLKTYYQANFDGLVLAAKVVSRFNKNNDFTLPDLYRIERNHYYDNNYLMAYIPEDFKPVIDKIMQKKSIELSI